MQQIFLELLNQNVSSSNQNIEKLLHHDTSLEDLKIYN